jgi:NRAMP (natural resistance-associated macrophage protein)-like metal ion transporter
MTLLPDEAITEVELKSTVAPKHSRRAQSQFGFGRFMRVLGPGVVTGAADDDPSGIATYSQAGAQFGLAMPWVMLATYPLMTAVQEACVRIGAVTGKGLAEVVRSHYSRAVLYPVVLLVVVANTLNIGSDIGAMAASAQLLLPGVPFALLVVVLAVLMMALEVFVPYKSYVKMLKWLALTLIAYFLTAFLVQVPWREAILSTLVPKLEFSPAFIYILVGILGTTISPYLFFWQTSEVVEEEVMAHRLAQRGGVPRIGAGYLRRLRIDNAFGMLFSNVTAWFIMVVAAVVLGQHGITNITSAADAARALEPLVHGFPHAGYLAKVIFSVGVIGIGLLSVPVLAGSSSYAISETFHWKEGLYRKFKRARGFYLVIILGTLTGMGFNFLGFDPIKMLILTAVFNGIAAGPLILVIARLSSRRDIMGEYASGWWSKLGLWTTFGVMTLAALGLMWSFLP